VLGGAERRQLGSFNLYGHQFVCHLNPRLGKEDRISFDYTPAEGHGVPVPHGGVALDMNAWNALLQRLKQHRAELVGEP